MNEEERKAFKVINTRTRRLFDELEIEKEDMSDEPKIAYLMQEIRANKTILNLIEKLQKENKKLREYYEEQNEVNAKFIPIQKTKNKIAELNNLLADIDYKDIEDKQEREFYKKEYYQVVAQIKVLKELLKEEE